MGNRDSIVQAVTEALWTKYASGEDQPCGIPYTEERAASLWRGNVLPEATQGYWTDMAEVAVATARPFIAAEAKEQALRLSLHFTEVATERDALAATLDKVRALVDPDGMPDLDPHDGWELGYAYAMREVRAVLDEGADDE